MSLKSSSGSTPCAYIFMARVMMSTLPVRSPFPNNVPSIRSAPARSPISESATPQPRSLCGWRDTITFSLYFIFSHIYSIWLAYTWGMECSTVTGRLMIAFLSGVGFHTSSTALHTSKAYSGSVPVKLSGLYSNRKFPSVSSASFFRRAAPSTAIFRISSLDFLKTCSLWLTDVELYTWMIARGAPFTASKVFLIMCSLAWVRTWMVTSSGIRFCSMRARRNSYSVSEAAGKPTSISLNPILTNNLKNAIFCSRLMGITNAWLPSRRSTLHQIGAFSTYSFSAHFMQRTGGIWYCLTYFLWFIIIVVLLFFQCLLDFLLSRKISTLQRNAFYLILSCKTKNPPSLSN